MDDDPLNNSGSSVVKVVGSNGMNETYTVYGDTNVLSDLSDAVVVSLPWAGTYTFSLTASDFKEHPNYGPQEHVVAFGNSNFGDFETFTLNGVDDSAAFTVEEGTVHLFFMDTLTSDNSGSSTVEVTGVPRVPSLSPAGIALLGGLVVGIGGLAVQRRRRAL